MVPENRPILSFINILPQDLLQTCVFDEAHAVDLPFRPVLFIYFLSRSFHQLECGRIQKDWMGQGEKHIYHNFINQNRQGAALGDWTSKPLPFFMAGDGDLSTKWNPR